MAGKPVKPFRVVVSGCPRSGTSLMMLCLRQALGKDKIMGYKWPGNVSTRRLSFRKDDETDEEYAARQYVLDKKRNTRKYKTFREKKEKDKKISRRMNPHGFWECRYTVRGCRWHPGFPVIKSKVVKIVNSGLVKTNPAFVDKIIMMVRHPRQVAKSQEDLKRQPYFTDEERKEIRIHSPYMFCKDTIQVSKWFLENKADPLIVSFDDLISDPDTTLERVRSYIGEGDFSNHPVVPSLKRSKPREVDHHLWEHAETLHTMFLEGRFKDIQKYHEEHFKDFVRDDIKTPCTRLNSHMSYTLCQACHSGDKNFIHNSVKTAESRGIDWKEEPCIFECMTDPYRDTYTPLEESVKTNHWVDHETAWIQDKLPAVENMFRDLLNLPYPFGDMDMTPDRRRCTYSDRLECIGLFKKLEEAARSEKPVVRDMIRKQRHRFQRTGILDLTPVYEELYKIKEKENVLQKLP